MVLVTGTEALSVEYTTTDDRITKRIQTPGLTARTSVPVARPDIEPHATWWRSFLAGHRPVVDGTSNGTIRTVDLFCGPGGLSLGFGQAAAELGFTPRSVAAVDEDAGALAVYASNHGPDLTANDSVSMLVDYHVKGAGDAARFAYPPSAVTDEWEALVGGVDVILAGPPCQGHSNLNNRTRRDDPRNRLYLTVPALAVALEAPIVVIENVPSVVHDHSDVVASALALLRGAGYRTTAAVVHADRLGWPQTRSRYFVVARRDVAPLDLEAVAATLERPALDVMWAIGDVVDGPHDDFMFDGPQLSEENVRRIDWLFDNDEYDLSLAERPDCHKEGTTYTSVYGRLRPDRPAPTITTGFFTPGRGRFTHPTRRRTLNAREAARIQGFPDSYRFQHDPAEIPPRSQLAKWIGDAVPMPLGHAAGLSALAPGWTTSSASTTKNAR